MTVPVSIPIRMLMLFKLGMKEDQTIWLGTSSSPSFRQSVTSLDKILFSNTREFLSVSLPTIRV
jgi:hypothetical protein